MAIPENLCQLLRLPPTHPPHCEVCGKRNGAIRSYVRHLAAQHADDPQSEIAHLATKALQVTCHIGNCEYSSREDAILRHLRSSTERDQPTNQLHSRRQILDFCHQHGSAPPLDECPADLAKRAKNIMTALDTPKAARWWRDLASYWAERGFEVAGAGWRLGQVATQAGITTFTPFGRLTMDHNFDNDEAESLLQGGQGYDPPSATPSHMSLSGDAAAYDNLAGGYDILPEWDYVQFLDERTLSWGTTLPSLADHNDIKTL